MRSADSRLYSQEVRQEMTSSSSTTLASHSTPPPIAPTSCSHCGLPLPKRYRSGRANADGTVPSFCCSGCEYVYGAIHQLGLTDFYRYRAPGEGMRAPTPLSAPTAFTFLDDPASRLFTRRNSLRWVRMDPREIRPRESGNPIGAAGLFNRGAGATLQSAADAAFSGRMVAATAWLSRGAATKR